MKSTNLINVAVLGLGVGQKHVEAFARLPEVNSIYVYDTDDKKVEETIRLDEAKIKPTTYQDTLENSKINVVSIATYDHDHGKQVKEFLNAGKDIFVEKPLCTSFEELEEIKRSLKNSPNLTLMSNLVLREAELYKWLKTKIKAGDFGEIYSFEGDYLYGRLHKIIEGWRSQSPNYSVMLGGGIHMIDRMIDLTDQNPIKVSSFGNKIVTKLSSFSYRDNVTSIFHFDSGMIAKISANFGCVHPHQHFLRIYGTKATFILDDQGPRVFWKRGDSEVAEKINLNHLPESKGALIPEFMKRIKEKEINLGSQHEIDLISIICAADKALDTGHCETINYL